MATGEPHWPDVGGGDIVIIPSAEPASPYPSLVSELAAERTTEIRLKMAPLVNVRLESFQACTHDHIYPLLAWTRHGSGSCPGRGS